MKDSKNPAKALREILSKYCSHLIIQELLRRTTKDQSAISEAAGKEKNAISKNQSEAEEITVSTFLRYWEAVRSSTKEEVALDDIYTPEIQKTVHLICLVKDLPDFKEFIVSEKDFFNNHSFRNLILNKKKHLSPDQQAVGEAIIHILKGDFKNE